MKHALNSTTIKKVKDRQFLALGYGINSYFDILQSFIKLFFILTIINVLIMFAYHSFDGLKSLTGVAQTASWSIGNLGSSQSVCSPVNFGVGSNMISCPYGTI